MLPNEQTVHLMIRALAGPLSNLIRGHNRSAGAERPPRNAPGRVGYALLNPEVRRLAVWGQFRLLIIITGGRTRGGHVWPLPAAKVGEPCAVPRREEIVSLDTDSNPSVEVARDGFVARESLPY
ncbi:unnamed protein product, partial [Iphiclides podalirius]